MRAEDLKLDELLQFSEKSLQMKGRRLVVHDWFSLAQVRRDLVVMLGQEQARRVLTRFGYFSGQTSAAAMKRLFNWDSTREWLRAGPILHELVSAGPIEYSIIKLDESAGCFQMEVTGRNSIEAEYHLMGLGTAKYSSCWESIGYASGYASYCLGKSVYFVEKQCKAAGAEHCAAVGKDRDSWGSELSAHLPYFQVDDVQGRVRQLTAQVRQQQLQLEHQRKLLEQAGRLPASVPVAARSREFLQVVEMAERVAKFDSSVLITGETSIGKELLARHIHNVSPRSNGPFVAVNCGALTETLLESELFGHKSGAFTGATGDHVGLFETANGGTIFLDEIGDITRALQLKLLRVLQEHEIMRVGEARSRKVDVRVIAATNRNLEKAVAEDKFRDDLFYRLTVVHIRVPPLRERREDLLPLAREFVTKCAARLDLPALKLDSSSLDCLLRYPWPGNVRELENAIEHAAVLCSNGLIRPENLPPQILAASPPGRSSALSNRSLEAVELDHIRRVLEETKGNREEAAKILKIGVTTLYRKLQVIKRHDAGAT
jgi:DNA-binding NtrC family response regulator